MPAMGVEESIHVYVRNIMQWAWREATKVGGK
jgi:hypothetical protein